MGHSWWIAALVGLALGIAGATLFFLSVSLDISRFMLSGFVTLAIAALLALIGILWYASRQRRALGEISTQVSDFVAELDKTPLASKMTELQTELDKINTQLEQALIDTTIDLRNLRDGIQDLHFTIQEKHLQVELNKFEPQPGAQP